MAGTSTVGAPAGGLGSARSSHKEERERIDQAAGDQGDENRQLVLHGGTADGEVQEDELPDDAFDFDPDEEEEAGGQPRYLAVARYYSGQNYNPRGLFEEMSKAWGMKEAVQVRSLGENMFIIEFSGKATSEFVINGGPWRHKGDALIVVAYDGFT